MTVFCVFSGNETLIAICLREETAKEMASRGRNRWVWPQEVIES